MHLILARLDFPDGAPDAAELRLALPRPTGVEHVHVDGRSTSADVVLFLALPTLAESESTARAVCNAYLRVHHPTARLVGLGASLTPGTEDLLLGPDTPGPGPGPDPAPDPDLDPGL
ncbi:hypothetical protein [Kitasatospora purpeofusca]|uniref:hypothetical protein n=1 Tax=Kitasatospora purpeofusca TaxID=67352 RepID=UPI00386A4B40|nr:hypothetical protein OIP63_21125 [Kitasatospora purpeofusca]